MITYQPLCGSPPDRAHRLRGEWPWTVIPDLCCLATTGADHGQRAVAQRWSEIQTTSLHRGPAARRTWAPMVAR